MKPLNLATLVCETATLIMLLDSFRGGEAYPISAAVQAVIILTIPALLARAKIISLPWILVVWLFALNFLHYIGVRYALYDTIWWWDILTHMVTVMLIAIFILMLLLLVEKQRKELPSSFLFFAFFIIITVTTFGVIWELLEFFFDNLFTMHLQYSLGDTVKDLTVDMIAGTMVAMLAPLYFRRHSRREVVEGLETGESLEEFIGRLTYG